MNNRQKHKHGGKRTHAGRPSRAPISRKVNFKTPTVRWLVARGALGPEVRRIVEAAQEAVGAMNDPEAEYLRIAVTLLRTVLNDEEME